MPIELRSWLNPQSYSNSYSTAPIAREVRAGIEEKYEWGQAFLPPATTLAEKAAAICLHYGTAEQITESMRGRIHVR
jgi:hypothetical protein